MENRIDVEGGTNPEGALNLVIMNFSGVYRPQGFYKKHEHVWLNCEDIQGTNCYCDEDAQKEIKERIRETGPYGIHFLDSGNYHYISKIWLDKVEEDFELLVLDHHTDMQMPMFGDILSCGGWIRAALKGNPGLKRVWLAGPARQADNESEIQEYGGRVVWIDEEILGERDGFREYLSQSGLPLYLSLDKDVLDPCWSKTNWDQGNAKLADVLECLKDAFSLRRVIGVDVCGENPEVLESGEGTVDMERNDRTNGEILEVLL